ncbi:MAG TPA: response regulator [Exilispira sp.]|nr:response regulator [Exilispira sp.]
MKILKKRQKEKISIPRKTKIEKPASISFKKYFILIESFAFFLSLFILCFTIFISLNSMLRSTIENQNLMLSLFSEEVEYLKNHSIEYILNIHDEKTLSNFSALAPEEFNEIFILNKNYLVEKIYRKENKSIIYPGFSFENLYLKEYIEKNRGFAIFTTDILRTINDEISFYIIKLIQNEKYIIFEIKLDKIIKTISNQIKTENTFFIVTNANNYIIYSSSKSLNLYFIPKINLKYYSKNDNNLFIISQKKPAFFSNNFYFFVPIGYAFKEIIKNLPIFLTFIVILITFLIFKFIFNNKYFLFPLLKTTDIISKWKITELENEIPKFFLGFEEIANLTNTLIQKYFEFSNEYEQLQQAEATIRKMQKYLRNLIDSLPSAFISVDLEGNIIEWNKKAEELTKIKKDDAIGKKYFEKFPYLSKFKDNVKNILFTEKVETITKEIINGIEEKIVNVNIIPISQNGLSGVAFRIDDITELENLEKQIRQSQKMEVIGLLAGGIAHDFNNVLTGIISSISLIKELLNENPTLKNGELIDYIDILENSSLRAKDIVQKLLTLSRRKEEKLLPTNLKTCLNDIERICKSSLDKSIELKFINPFSEAIILGDHNLIVQAILNLCINASQAMTIMRKPGDKTGGTLIVKLEKANEDELILKKLIEQDNKKKKALENVDNNRIIETNFWKITVSDTGVGIPKEIQDKIFEPFFTTKQAFYGSGIGLSTVKMIVEEHNGFITFESEASKGTNFYIYLPILQIDKLLETEKEGESIKKGSGLILLVDDEQIVRTITKAMLVKLGYTALVASNSNEALEIYNKYKKNIKLIIIDIAIPGKSGIDIFKEIKLKDDQTKVLFISGLRINDNTKEIVEKEADGFLQKPFTINELSNKIFEILSKKN